MSHKTRKLAAQTAQDGTVPASAVPSELLLFPAEDGRTVIQVRLAGESLWLSQKDMSGLFLVSVPAINAHLRNIFSEGEHSPEAVIKEFLITATDGKNYRTKFYSLDVILAVGYRVRSAVGTRFRQWATERLREYLVKGFVLDDVRLKEGVPLGVDYFDELLARIRDIRSSEKVFYRKLRDIFKDLSADYPERGQDELRLFFQKVQNKIHWAAAEATAAEIIAGRADAGKPNMGLTNWSGSKVRKFDVAVAKNYLTEIELDTLNRVVTMFLEQAEFRAKRRQLIHMADWDAWLDEFLRFTDLPVLNHAGRVPGQGRPPPCEAGIRPLRHRPPRAGGHRQGRRGRVGLGE